jgi:hypothetical protein
MSSEVLPSQIESIGQEEKSCHRSMRTPLAFLAPPRILYIASERPNGLLDVGMPGTLAWSTVGRSTSQSELGSGLLGQFKVSTDRDGGGEFDGIVYMSVVALQEKISGI